MVMSYTIILGAVAFFVYLGSYAALVDGSRSAGDIGLAMSVSVFIAQMIMAFLLALSLNASTIANEKDQETFDLLNLTLFKSFEIAVGKYLSSTGFLFILVITALPIYALAFTFGGMTIEAFYQLAAVVVGMTLFISSIGILLSLVSTDVRTALGRSFFVFILIAVLSTIGGTVLISSFSSAMPNPVIYWLGYASVLINPIWAATDVFSPLSANLAWPVVPGSMKFLINGNLLWAYSAGVQAVMAVVLLMLTALLYPRYRTSSMGEK
jgi:ABC-type transport system involved in multi-copper enzyme maturation permease subunit